MAQSKKRKPQKKQAPVTQIFLGVAILLVAVLITAIFTSRNIRSDKTVLISSPQENVLLRHYMYFLNSMRYEYENEWANYGSTAAEMAELWNTVEDGKSWGDLLKEYALDTAKNIFTEYHLAKQAGFTETTEIINSTSDEIDGIVRSVFSGSSTPNTDFYKAYGLTIPEMKTLQSHIRLVNDWRGSINESTVVTEDAARAFHSDNRYYYDTVIARHVLIATGDMTEEEKADAEILANEILMQVNEGADIQELAELYSDDRDGDGVLNNEGEYEFGWDTMVAEFEEWAFNANAGDTGIVETSYGFHVMQLVREPLPYDELDDEFKEEITADAKNYETNNRIEEAISSAGIEWKLNESAFKNIKFN